jgi:LuxR family maltose regulon positive regulatory protein
MSTPILTTKLYNPPPRPELTSRPRLIERLNDGLRRKLTLISAPAGFGKTTLLSEWVAGGERPVAWLSLEEGENDPGRFLTYLIAALQTLALSKAEGIAARQSPVGNIGAGVLAALQSPQPPPTESILTALLNEIITIPNNFVLVLDDYHVIDAQPVDQILTFLLEHLPPQMHLVIATREDPHLPLARLRARGQLTELRAADLRFTASEAAGFLNQVMGLNLSAEDIAALETRTEGWIAGLQLAAISMQGHPDAASFIRSFTGSHHFVLDYLVEEVLQRQSESVQTFLLRTSILDRLCGSLCDAVLLDPSASGQETLEYLEHANLFIVPLDNERHWYRYHHLFRDLLRQRLHQSAASSTGDEGRGVAELHVRASVWYEDHGLEMEAFQHATAANDVERAERLIEGKGMPLHFRGAAAPVLRWLELLPKTVLDAHPSLWTTYASVLLVSGQETGVEQKLQAAEAALQGAEPNDKTRDLIGRIAAIRATMAANRYQVEAVIAQSRRALEYLHPKNLAFRTFTVWKLGYAYHIQGDRAAASRAYTEAISISQASENIITTIVATIGLGSIQETENQLYLSAETYRRALQLLGDQPLPVACEAHLGLARILYEWNDLEVAEQHCQQSIQLARQSENTDRFVACEVFLARLKRAQGDVASAAAILAEADQTVRRNKFVHRMPEVAATQVLTLLRQGDIAAAAHLAQTHNRPISQARVLLAQGDASAALAILEPFRQQMEAKGWQDERLKVMVLQAVALHAHGDQDKAMQLLSDALVLAEPGGFIRLFVDEGEPMRFMISDFRVSILKISPHLSAYLEKLLVAFPSTTTENPKLVLSKIEGSKIQGLVESLSQRELEVLRLMAQGLSNREISERLFLALDTIKGHNRRIFDKLQVQRRTEAIARARELGLL